MAAQKGLDVLMKIDISGTKTTIGGLRSTSITLNDESVDITNNTCKIKSNKSSTW